MEANHWLELQNGSDIRGIAIDGVKGEEVNLTPEIAEKIAVSFVFWLSGATGKMPQHLKISVGRDSRISGTPLKEAFINGLLSAGVTILDCGLASTPAMFMSIIFDFVWCDAAVMITASHLPYNRNGIKFFTKDGGLNKADITRILETISNFIIPPVKLGSVEQFDLLSIYSDFLVRKFRVEVKTQTPLKGFHIVVDAGNGAGGFFVEKVLKPLGADTSGSQFLEPDGMFPNHVPNPEDETAMEFLQKSVLTNKADLGIIFDTDVDRAAAVDCYGMNINRNRLIALISAIILEEYPGSAIVTDSITSDGLTEFIEKVMGGKHHRYRRGYKNVINEAMRLNSDGEPCWLAIETSGHAALKENNFLDDGAYLITKILIKAAKMRQSGQNLLDLVAELLAPAESKEFRFKILNRDFKKYGKQIICDLNNFIGDIPGWEIVPKNYEGVRIACNKNSGDGWFLLRLSLHDPVIPLNIESNQNGGVMLIAQKFFDFIKKYEDIDHTSLANYLKSNKL
jgi:phosphomannomutase